VTAPYAQLTDKYPQGTAMEPCLGHITPSLQQDTQCWPLLLIFGWSKKEQKWF